MCNTVGVRPYASRYVWDQTTARDASIRPTERAGPPKGQEQHAHEGQDAHAQKCETHGQRQHAGGAHRPWCAPRAPYFFFRLRTLFETLNPGQFGHLRQSSSTENPPDADCWGRDHELLQPKRPSPYLTGRRVVLVPLADRTDPLLLQQQRRRVGGRHRRAPRINALCPGPGGDHGARRSLAQPCRPALSGTIPSISVAFALSLRVRRPTGSTGPGEKRRQLNPNYDEITGACFHSGGFGD